MKKAKKIFFGFSASILLALSAIGIFSLKANAASPNLAYGGKVTASDYFQQDGWDLPNIVDGKVGDNKGWHCNPYEQHDTHWVMVELNKESKIDTVELYATHQNDFASQFKISVSTDGTNFKYVFEQTESVQVDPHKSIKASFQLVDAKFVKYEVTKKEKGNNTTLAEMKVYNSTNQMEITDETNLALDATATYSDYFSWDGSWGTNYIIDNSVGDNKGWHCDPSKGDNPHFIILELADVYEFNQIELYSTHQDDFAQRVKISGSLNGEDYTEICNQTEDMNLKPNSKIIIKFENTKAKFVKLEITKKKPGNTTIGEFKIFKKTKTGGNLAIEANVKASSSFDWAGTWGLGYVNDGKKLDSKGWHGQPGSQTNWLEFDFGSKIDFSNINIVTGHQDNTFPTKFDILYSLDGTSWEVFYSTGDEKYPAPKAASTLMFNLEGNKSVSARYVKIDMKEAGTSGYFQIGEVEILNIEDTGIISFANEFKNATLKGDEIKLDVPYSYTSLEEIDLNKALILKEGANASLEGDFKNLKVGLNSLNLKVSNNGKEKVYKLTINRSNNLASGAKVTARSCGTVIWNLDWLTDMDKTSAGVGYSSDVPYDTDHTEWVTVDLGENTNLNNVKIFPVIDGDKFIGIPIDFDIQISNDNENFLTVYSERGNSDFGKTVDVNLPNVNARYIRVYSTKLCPIGTQYFMRFRELEVYENNDLVAHENAHILGIDSKYNYTVANDIIDVEIENGIDSIKLNEVFKVKDSCTIKYYKDKAHSEEITSLDLYQVNASHYIYLVLTDGSKTEEYKVRINKLLSSNCVIESIEGGTINPLDGVISVEVDYTVNQFVPVVKLPEGATFKTFLKEDSDELDFIEGNLLALGFGENTYYLKTYAADGITTKIYTLKITRKAATEANLEGILNFPELEIKKEMEVNVENEVSSLDLGLNVSFGATASVYENQDCTQKVDGNLVLNVGNNVFYIKVVSQDMNTTNIYKITLVRAQEEITPEPTPEPTPEETEEPTVEPTEEPTVEPTEEPTEEPTVEPTEKPTEEQTEKPTEKPTTPEVSTPEEHEKPKRKGCSGSVIATIFGLSALTACAFVLRKKKND